MVALLHPKAGKDPPYFLIDALDRFDGDCRIVDDDPIVRRVVEATLRGVDVDALIGMTFALDSGSGPVRFRAHRPANPCAWMNEAIAPGAHRALLRRGGIRAEPLTDGALALGRAVLTVEPAEVSRR